MDLLRSANAEGIIIAWRDPAYRFKVFAANEVDRETGRKDWFLIADVNNNLVDKYQMQPIRHTQQPIVTGTELPAARG